MSCLVQYAPDDRGHYLCYLGRKNLPSRIRVFIDYMAEQTRRARPAMPDHHDGGAGTLIGALAATRCVPAQAFPTG
ncbi:hypothetical protein B0G75_13132 [Paraburkholderia sp. BL18I3N2]|nr:hypothetical protein B0G75_13132 [Paraburkholderia sp. BL18I3N2]